MSHPSPQGRFHFVPDHPNHTLAPQFVQAKLVSTHISKKCAGFMIDISNQLVDISLGDCYSYMQLTSTNSNHRVKILQIHYYSYYINCVQLSLTMVLINQQVQRLTGSSTLQVAKALMPYFGIDVPDAEKHLKAPFVATATWR